MTFQDLNLNKSLFSALEDLRLSEPTAIQHKVFSPIMAGKDVVGIAQTGTGKTFAYLLPSLRNWRFSKSPYPNFLIIVPTRELVAQVVDEVNKLTAYMSFVAVGVYGGTNMKTHVAQVEDGCNMIVGTPGRLLEMQTVFKGSVGVIHSSKSQNNRFATVDKFHDGTCRVLIATDIIARGLDVSGVTHVINFDMPDVAEKYIHRIGRTGRAEQKGKAISFVAEKEQDYKKAIEELMNIEIAMLDLPENVEFSEELIELEVPKDIIPFNNHKHKQYVPTGDAFHEKKDKNKKENQRTSREDKMKKKYKKPIKKSGSWGGKRKG
ncbi:UNVERIFIED_CONTAM: hypothetical protein GTU68_039526 [Idotea baltica]|nr:hypothetical protein [Idotea baltica]